MYFDSASGTALVTTGSQIEESLMFAQRSVTMTLVNFSEKRRIASVGVRFEHVRTFGCFQFDFEGILLGPKSSWPFIVIDIWIHVVEAIVAELFFAAAVHARRTGVIKTPPVHVKHGARLMLLAG